MEIFESPITNEEARNYHQFYYKLRALDIADWIKAYFITIAYVVFLLIISYIFVPDVVLDFLYTIGIFIETVLFMLFYVLIALQTSKSIQLRAMLDKYVIKSLYQEAFLGKIRLKKVRVCANKLQVYYIKLEDNN